MADLGSVGIFRYSRVFSKSIDRSPGVVPVFQSPNKPIKVWQVAGWSARVLGYNRVHKSSLVRKEATWAESPLYPLLFTDVTGVLTGTVRQNRVLLVGAKVSLYYRPNGFLIDSKLSKADGTFRFEGLLPGVSDYFMIAFDPDGGFIQNSQLFDRVKTT